MPSNGISKSTENKEKESIMNLPEVLHKRAIKLTFICHQTTLNHCAAANSGYFNHQARQKCHFDVNFKIAGDPFAIVKFVLMFLLSKEHTWGLGIRTLCYFLSLRNQ